jgi:formate dehydrogenase maturation protein FdhE
MDAAEHLLHRDPVQPAFGRRAVRASALAQQSSSARAPLEFAAGLLQAQGALADAIDAVHSGHPLCGNLADDLGAFEVHLAIVLSFVADRGPAILRDLARQRTEDPRARLAAFWRDGGSGRDDYLSRALLRPYAEVLAARGVDPHRSAAAGGCPVCRGFPAIAWRESSRDGEGAQRVLGCGLCSHAWPIQRILCPTCGEERPDKLPAFQSDRYPAARIEACATCRAYVKSIDLTVDAFAVPEVDDLASLSLDVWASEQGYERLEPGLAGI